MLYRLLGPLEVHRDGVAVDLGPPKQRAVLAVLLLAAGRVVSTDRLIESVWGASAPPSAVSGIHVYISHLRRALREGSAASPVLRQPPGYVLQLPVELLDSTQLAMRTEAARAAVETGDWSAALSHAEAGLALWRGPVLADLQDEPWVEAEAVPLQELRAECREIRISALLALGRVPPALQEAGVLHDEQPLRERATWLLVLALHRAGRTPEALAAHQRYVRQLDDELGLEPGAAVRDLQTAVLRQDPALAAWPRAPHWTGAVQVAAPQTPAAPVTEPPVAAPDPLVGRGREVEQITRAVVDAAAGAVRWLLLSGPAGIGKTRLAVEAADRMRDAGGETVWVRCSDEDGAPAWWPVQQLVIGLGADPATVLRPPQGIDPDEARFAVYERVLRLVEEAAEHRPLLVVVDDVQWADRTSARCLAHLAASLRDHRLALVLTLRDGEAGRDAQPLLAAVARALGSREVLVPPLSEHDVRVLAEQIAGEPLDASQSRLLAQRTGGNPLFVREYARLPVQERHGEAIPTAVRSVLGRRLGGLSAAVLQVLRTAAVIGDVLDVELLAAVTRLDLDTVADLLDEAADEHVIVAAPGVAGYAFTHGLLREEVLAQIPGLGRQRLHARVAEALADGGAPGRRAQHLLGALPLGDPADVLTACRLAAQDAEQRWASDEAAHWWASAVHVSGLVPDLPVDERNDLQVAQVEALVRAGRGQSVLDVVDAGLLEAVRSGRTSAAGRLAAALLRAGGAWPWMSYGEAPGPLLERLAGVEPYVAADPAAHARVLAALAVGSCYSRDPAVPDRLSMQALATAERLGDPEVLADALLGRLMTYAGVAAHSHESRELAARIWALPHRQSRLDDVIAHAVMTMTEMHLGNPTGSREHQRHVIAASDLLRLPILRLQMRWLDAVHAQWRGDLDAAEATYRTVVELHRQTELHSGGSVQAALHTVRLERGQVADIEDIGTVEPLAWQSAIAAARGDRDTAIRLAEEWLDPSAPDVWTTLAHQALLAGVVADLAHDAGPEPELVALARRLLTLLEPFHARIAIIGQVGVLGPVALAAARLHAALGEPEQAQALLDQATALAEETGGALALTRCRLLAARLQALPQPSHQRQHVADAAAHRGLTGVSEQATSGT